MKNSNINIGSLLLTLAAVAFTTACQDPDYIEANPDAGGTPASLSANFLFVNASPDAPSLDLFINNEKSGSSLNARNAQSTYSKISITSNGGITAGNTNIRAKATTGSIGGVLANSDVVFRGGNNNTNLFTAVDSAYYTVIAVDSITRPRPVRKLDEGSFGDTTFVVRSTGAQIGVVEWRALAPLVANRRGVDAIGIVPLGATDPGGIRFLVVTDQLPLPSTTRFPKPATGKCAVRFINASPNTASASGTVTLTVGGTNVNQGLLTNQLAFPGFNPSVGSRTVTSNAYVTSINAPLAQDIIVTQNGVELARLNGFNFENQGVYTVVLSGNRRTLPMSVSVIKNK